MDQKPGGWRAIALGPHRIAVSWISVVPVNATLVPLTPETLPANWPRLRDQWEYAQATRAVLQLAAIAAFLRSLAFPAPESTSGPPRMH